MTVQITDIAIGDIYLDKAIYPRLDIDHRRVALFTDNIRDGFRFDPIEVEPDPDREGKYRILDGAHRFQAYKKIGKNKVPVAVISLNQTDPLLYSASRAMGPQQLTEDDARSTARRAYQNNHKLTSSEIGKFIGRSRQAVDVYIADLRAAVNVKLDLIICRMHRLGVSQDRIAGRLGEPRETVRDHLAKMPELANPPIVDLKRGFTVPQVAEKHCWPEPHIWSIALEGKDDLQRFKALKWGLRPWDVWGSNDCDKRFGDDWPGRIPAQMIAHILYYFSEQGDLVLDPMAGGGVVADTCLAFNRRCWSFDMEDRPDTRPEIEPYFWDINILEWPIKGKAKPDLILFDPPYFKKQAHNYDPDGISGLSKEKYLEFLGNFFSLAHLNAKKTTQMAFINADWRDFQNTPARNEMTGNSIMIDDYLHIIKKSGWHRTHIIQAPLSSERFNAGVVSAMQKKKILGVTSRYIIVSEKK